MKKITRNLWIVICTIALLIIGLSTSTSAAEETTVIKVGYMLNYGMIKSPMISGSEGYGYEYLNKIFDYAEGNYELEFVYCEWSEVESLLSSGAIDIVGPITYSEENDARYLFPDENCGDNIIFLSTLSENGSHYNDVLDIDNSTIAVQVDNPNITLLYDFLDENDIDGEIVFFDETDYEEVMISGEYDFCLTSSLQTYDELSPVVSLGTLNSYFVTDKNNTEVMSIINEGMAAIKSNEFMYQEKLYLKYYDYSILTSFNISDSEFEYIQEQEVYNIGVKNVASAISYKDAEGQLQGVAIDVVEMLAEILDIDYNLIEVTEATTEEELRALDFSFFALESAGIDGIVLSDTYYEIPFVLVDRYISEEQISTIGILTSHGITELELEDHLYGRSIYEYENINEIVEAYNEGIIDSFITTTPTLNLIRSNMEELDFYSETMDISLNLSIEFTSDYDKEKISIINKAIAQLDEATMEYSVLVHATESISDVSIMEYLEANPIIIVIIVAIIICIIGVTEYKRRSALYKMLNYDTLTGLSTQYRFNVRTNKALAKKFRKKKYSIVTIDIDNFKYINEFYGYDVGTLVLKKVARTIKENAVHSEVVARVNADNFLLLLRKNEVDEKLKKSLIDGNGLFKELRRFIDPSYIVTFSIGVYDIDNPKLDLNFMIDCANQARNLGKNTAKTSIHKFTSDMNSSRIINNDIIANMTKALMQSEFVIYYQPKMELETETLVGAEALVRWMKDGKLIPPNNFIPIFERNGFIEKLDYYVLGKVCEFIKANPSTPIISVNLSGVTIVKLDLVENIMRIMEKYGVLSSKIEFEITETAFVEQFDQAVKSLQELRGLGFQIAMDDFGVGISSLNRLKYMPIDTLKIDRSFIIDAIDNDKGSQIIKNIVNMTKDLNLETVAEGIETKEHEAFLLNLGCDIGQGYYFARPLSANDYIKLLKKRKYKKH